MNRVFNHFAEKFCPNQYKKHSCFHLQIDFKPKCEVRIQRKPKLTKSTRWLGWLCFTSHRQRCYLETAPPLTVPCEGREAR